MAEVLILPGLDGTSTLHDEFVAELLSFGIACRSIAYPPDRSLGYSELAELVRSNLPTDRPYVLLGESFSGPVAILVAAANPGGLSGLILSTTFARAPLSFLGWAAQLTRVAPTYLPAPLISWFLLGRWGSRSLIDRVQSAISTVRPEVLRARAAAAMRADVSGALPAISVPTLVFRARHDRLLALVARTALVDGLRNTTQIDLDGPHLLLQTQPKLCAQAIAEFVRGLARHPC
jgi:pimeloyl-ACP methyl ester carboxylesterase